MDPLVESKEATANDEWLDATPDHVGWGTTSEPWAATRNYRDEDCIAAIRGERVPSDIWDAPRVTQLCLLRGIRHHQGFAAELRSTPGLKPEFVRAFNARDIMSDVIPHMAQPDEFPYCIWYPDVASEATYRALATRYPQIRYHVGRACAVAGYADLYEELGLEPDVSIAEEARDNRSNQGGQKIFDMIMRQPVLLWIMDDYTRSVTLNKPLRRLSYGLNGDTSVRSTLDMRCAFGALELLSRVGDGEYRAPIDGGDHPPPYFNVTEDWRIDSYTSELKLNSPEMLSLLWNPLPVNLPEGNKDVLILTAAYFGDIDRYIRLRRPGCLLTAEPNCITRGIYHNTPFAKWWSQQPANERYHHAINARFIMNNDVSRITPSTPCWALPYLIWYPTRVHEATYAELARRRPDMVPAVARACIVAVVDNAAAECGGRGLCLQH